ncbi:cartilage intermediate layer protein 1 [Astyanax mexicanus]|uniref:Cartilage intermediate layer protein 1 n=1 Tax=Astyanax mexicanus TaxID=7994 RepID=A0A8B9KZ28_ASTMX|nr:cartilage intermediate layer protein 1 [Astyanax mexicanus]XP_022525320.2 cartilage intermediate layer protein 1 [Astyanax mexicanus]KAG9266588.1 cartilage intermediate layer protein 1 [Astyanax mexicanus]
MSKWTRVALALCSVLTLAQGSSWNNSRVRKSSQRTRNKLAFNNIFEPQTTGVTEWTSWFNIDHPGGNGDYERLEAIRFYYRERVCARPVAMEARTTDWVAASDTGEVVHSSLEKGFWCINKEQPYGRICSNYHVRFQCPPVLAYWTDWTAWSSCSATACNDVGIQVRRRKCMSTQPMPALLTPTCPGPNTERRECSTPPCRAKWGQWGMWSACSVTCGKGRRGRRRSCMKSSDDVECTGRPVEVQKCGNTPCAVVCQRVCPEGRPSEDCTHCVCEGKMLEGEVLSVTGVPVSGASVAVSDRPKLIRTLTDAKGLFKIPGVCSGPETQLLISKEKYAPATVPVYSNSSESLWIRVLLRSSEKPYIVKHPEDKVRYEGQRVILCCKATGTPSPDKYHWYHNGTLLDQKKYKYDEDLVLRDLKPEESGEYHCKATSLTGSIKSSPAFLTVFAKRTPACKASPESHLVRLPIDCKQPGTQSKFYNAGRCPHNSCPGSQDFDLRCRDVSSFCCGVKQMEAKQINCGGYTLPIKVVSECSCQKCVEPKILVRGRVVAADNNEPLRFGHIVMGRERVGTTGYQGGFTIQVPSDTQRLVVNFVDPSQKFVDTLKVFIFDKKSGAVYHDVKVMRKKEPVDISAAETNTIYLGEIEDEDPIGQLVIPPNSFHKSTGETYEGTVKASVTFFDPRNITAAAASPGDLNFVGDEGDILPLRTYGMFSVDFRDDANKEILGAGEVQVLLDTQHVKMQEHIPAMKLWSLNPDTGIWEEEGNFQPTQVTTEGNGRRKREERTFLIGNMEIRERRLFNLDVPESRRCYVKVRAYMSDKFLPTEQLEGVVISLINLEPKPGYSSNPRAWGRFDSVITGSNGACLPAFCDGQRPDAYTAYVTAIMGGEELEAAPSAPKMNPNIIGVSQPYLDKLDYQRSDHDNPALKKTAFRINLAKPNANNLDETNGPIYAYQNLIECENAPADASHFRFFRVEKDKYEYNVVPFEESDLTSWTGDYLSWWPNPQEFRACYIKVKIQGATEVMVRSRNLGGTHSMTRGQLYGIRDIRSTRDMNHPNTSAACLEFKCGGMLFDQAAVDRSLISVIPQGNCRRTGINNLLQEYLTKHPPVLQNNETHAFNMLAPVDPLGHNYGIYTVTDQNPRIAKEIAIGRCFDGTSDGFSREMKSDSGVALVFSCPKRTVNRESLFQRLQTNPGQTLAQMARDMRESQGMQVRRGLPQVVAYPSDQQARTQGRRTSTTNRRRTGTRTQPRK